MTDIENEEITFLELKNSDIRELFNTIRFTINDFNTLINKYKINNYDNTITKAILYNNNEYVSICEKLAIKLAQFKDIKVKSEKVIRIKNNFICLYYSKLEKNTKDYFEFFNEYKTIKLSRFEDVEQGLLSDTPNDINQIEISINDLNKLFIDMLNPKQNNIEHSNNEDDGTVSVYNCIKTRQMFVCGSICIVLSAISVLTIIISKI